jgi:hypothetical protein
VDHIIPPSQGGADADMNLALACRGCNLRKANHVDCLNIETQTAVRLYHPRLDQWDEHFSVSSSTGEIAGVTAIGRGTVARLKLNTQAQLAARQQWMQLGLFP